jgi:DNA-directed RNA polymerase specialized sigma24 family protein
MSCGGSVTGWLDQLKAGDRAAAQQLWARYFSALVKLARKKLRDLPRRTVDEEDVALSAFDSFCRAAEQQRFPRLDDRHDLWQVLALLTVRKVTAHQRHEHRQKRGGGAVLGESALANLDSLGQGMDQFLAKGPTPEFVVEVTEEFRRLLDTLGDDRLRTVAVRKMEGYTTKEIARELACEPRTVERKLRAIRKLWEHEVSA